MSRAQRDAPSRRLQRRGRHTRDRRVRERRELIPVVIDGRQKRRLIEVLGGCVAGPLRPSRGLSVSIGALNRRHDSVFVELLCRVAGGAARPAERIEGDDGVLILCQSNRVGAL